MPSVCVVVPCYRDYLARYEQVSIKRCVSILGHHPIAVIKPTTLELRGLWDKYKSLTRENFPDRYFSSIAGYNQLLLSDQFYARFEKYDYILIHQLDAFVFSDQLAAWCTRGYDYVGAPWIANEKLPTWRDEGKVTLERLRTRTKHLFGRRTWKGHLPDHMYSVGNGGFSLRRVAKMRAILKKLSSVFENDQSIWNGKFNEDILLTVVARTYMSGIKIPSITEAAAFSWELHPAVGAQLTRGVLPFGCHAWNKLHRDEWRPIFAQLGYSLDELLS